MGARCSGQHPSSLLPPPPRTVGAKVMRASCHPANAPPSRIAASSWSRSSSQSSLPAWGVSTRRGGGARGNSAPRILCRVPPPPRPAPPTDPTHTCTATTISPAPLACPPPHPTPIRSPSATAARAMASLTSDASRMLRSPIRKQCSTSRMRWEPPQSPSRATDSNTCIHAVVCVCVWDRGGVARVLVGGWRGGLQGGGWGCRSVRPPAPLTRLTPKRVPPPPPAGLAGAAPSAAASAAAAPLPAAAAAGAGVGEGWAAASSLKARRRMMSR